MAEELSLPAGENLSWWQRCLGVFLDPVRTFASVVRQPGFWAPLIALVVISFATTQALIRRVGMEQVVRRSLEMSGRASNMTPEQLERAVAVAAKVGSISANIASLIGVPIVLVIIAALGLLIMKVVYGQSPSFKAAFSVAAHADLPMLIAGILTLMVIAFGDPASMNPGNLSPTNIGFFLSPQTTSKAVYSLATSADVFSLWVLGLLGVGFAATSSGKARPRAIFGCFFALWVIWVLIKTGLALI